MVIFSKKAIVTILTASIVALTLIAFFSWTAVYTIEVEGKPIAYLESFQQGRKAVTDYLTQQQNLYGKSADFQEQVIVRQKFKTSSVNFVTSEEAGLILADNTTTTVKAAVITIEGQDITAVADEKTANEILDSFKNQEKVIGDAVQVISSHFQGQVEVTTKRLPVNEIKNKETAASILEQNENFRECLNLVLEYTEIVDIEKGTTVIPSDSYIAGKEETIAAGENGIAENRVRAVISGNNIKETDILDSKVISEPQNDIIIESTEELFYDVRAHGGLGTTDIPIKGQISATFGSSGEYWLNSHTGTDIAAPQGTAIRSLGRGTVTAAGWQGSYGYMVTINHGEGIETRYAHMEAVNVEPGDEIEIGSVIGYCGSTGNATGSHLHLEVKINGEFQDPQSLF